MATIGAQVATMPLAPARSQLKRHDRMGSTFSIPARGTARLPQRRDMINVNAKAQNVI
jgi:hypothetical protein